MEAWRIAKSIPAERLVRTLTSKIYKFLEVRENII